MGYTPQSQLIHWDILKAHMKQIMKIFTSREEARPPSQSVSPYISGTDFRSLYVIVV